MDNNEERYVISPKGCAWLALKELGMLDNVSDTKFNAFWILFENYMKNAGYIQEDVE